MLGDRSPTLEDIRALGFTTRCLNEAMRLYPQPPVLIRRALEDDIVGGFRVIDLQHIASVSCDMGWNCRNRWLER